MAGRTVFISGSGTGIGRITALRLARAGHRVFAGVLDSAEGEALRREASGQLQPIICDITSDADLKSARSMVEDAVGAAGLSGLVNNAAVPTAGPVEIIPLADLRRALEVNVVGQVGLTQAMLPALRLARGRIVNLSSVAGLLALPYFGPYAMSKFAVEAMSDCLRQEMRPWGIRVSVVEPGVIATGFWGAGAEYGEGLAASLPEDAIALYADAVARMPRLARKLGRIGSDPHDVARAIEHALTARRPRTRYRVGRQSRAVAILSRLPDGVRDWAVGRL
jgi:NAD(P)-dependent dehydrogenase (short-subunit alcohol dehydrogenase family)